MRRCDAVESPGCMIPWLHVLNWDESNTSFQSTFPLDSVDEDVQWIHSKPLLFTECRSHVLQLLQAVCAKVDSHWPSSHAVGSASITIVLRWGNVIPWCWKFFHDERMAYSEYLSDVVSPERL